MRGYAPYRRPDEPDTASRHTPRQRRFARGGGAVRPQQAASISASLAKTDAPSTIIKPPHRLAHGEKGGLGNDGFEWEGRPYRSLSAIARAITGTRWNGWAFFGLQNRRGRA